MGNPDATLKNSIKTARTQFKDYALVRQNTDGTYQIRLEYYSQETYDMFQVIDPEQLDELKKDLNDGGTALAYAPLGTFNEPETYKNTANAQKHKDAGNITAEADKYYWQNDKVQVDVADAARDTGYITFDTTNLNDEWVVRSYFSLHGTFTSACSTTLIRLSEAEKVELPTSLTIEESETTIGYEWTNYASVTSKTDGTRSADDGARNFLNTVFEDEVTVKKNENGELTAVLTFRDDVLAGVRAEEQAETAIVSVKLAKGRTCLAAESASAVQRRQENLEVEWEELLGNGEQETLFEVLTKAQSDKNASAASDLKKGGYYGTLWLKGYEASTIEKEVISWKAVPLKKYSASSWSKLGTEEASPDYKQSGLNWLTHDYALVGEYSDGTYQVRIEYSSYSIWDMIQMLDPDKVKEFEEYYPSNIYSAPMGTFNEPEAYKNPSWAEAQKASGNITSEVNEYYLSNGEVSFEVKDEAMDIGYLMFDTDDLSQLIVIRALPSGENVNPKMWNNGTTASMEFRLDMENAEELPLGFTPDAEAGEIGYEWTNYARQENDLYYKRSWDSSVKSVLDSIFMNTVSYVKTDDGSIQATFTMREADASDPVTSIEYAVSRNTEIEEGETDIWQRRLAQEYTEAEWRTLQIEDGKATLAFDDLNDHLLFRVSNESNDKENALSSNGYQKYYYGQLRLSMEIAPEADEMVLESTNGSGAKLIANTNVLPENATFLAIAGEYPERAPESAKEINRESIAGYSKDEDSFVIWDYHIFDADGQELTPSGSVTIELPVPDTIDIERALFFYWGDNGVKYGNGLPVVSGKEIGELVYSGNQWVIRLTTTATNPTDFYFSIAVYDPGVPIEQEQLEALEEGLYEVRVTIANQVGTNASMSNKVIQDNRGILHVKEKGADYELYLQLKSVPIDSLRGFVSKMRVYDIEGVASEPVDTLAYFSAADLSEADREDLELESDPDNLILDDLCEEYERHYLYRVKLPLRDRYRGDSWMVGFNVPIMNAFTGVDIDDEKKAKLRILDGSITPIDGDNDLAGYHPSILKAEIDNANWYLDTLSDGDIKEKLQQAITAAETEYENQKVSLDEPTLLDAVETLKKARLEAGDEDEGAKKLSNGTYSIPYHLYDSSIAESDVSSEFETYFAERATLKVEGDYMTVTLENEPQKEDTVTKIESETGAGSNFEQAEFIQLDNGKSGFQFRRVYTEEAFELLIYTENQPLGSYVRLVFEFDLAESISNPATEEEIEELRNLVSTLNTLVETEGSLYTESSLKNLQDVIDKAETVLSISEPESDTVQTHIQNLETARDNLRKKADLEQDLKLAVEEAAVYLNGNYTEDSKAILQAAYDKAQNILDHLSDYTEAEIEEAIAALDEAESGLVPSEKEDLSALVDEYMQLTGEGYTEESWQKFQDALNEAQNILNREDAEPEDYEQALNTLKNAYEALETEIEDNEHLLKLSEILEQLKGELQDEAFYEASSYEAFLASVAASEDLLENGNLYEVTDEKIDLQIAALQTEFQALILIEDMPEGVQRAFNRVTFAKIDPEQFEDVEMEEMQEEELEETEEAELEETEAAETNPEETEAAESEAEETEAAETNPEETEAAESEAEETEAAETNPEETEAAESEAEETEAAESNPEETEAAESEAEETEAAESNPEETEVAESEAEETEAAESNPEETEVAESEPEEIETAEPEVEETEAAESESEETDKAEEIEPEDTDYEEIETADTAPRLSLSRRVLPLLTSSYITATPSNSSSNTILSVPEPYVLYAVDGDLEDGVYCVNYALWQFAENKASMGNPALMDAYPDRDGKQAKLVIEDSQAYLYLEFQAMEFNDQRGHLLEMYIMDNLVMEDNGEVIDTYDAVYPEIVEYTDETDDYGPPSGRKYPKLLKFDITKWMSQKETYIPVFVNVPVMGSSAEQPAKLRFYWNTLALVEGAGDPEDPEEQTVSTADLERLVEEAALVDPTGYTEASYYALEKSVMAADVLIQNAKKSIATQEMVDNRLAALEATLAALIENTSSGDIEDPDQPDTPVTEDPALKNLSRLIMEAALLYENDYTEESWKELRQALKSAVEVSYMDNPTSLAINRAYNTLKNAIENLEEAEEKADVNKTQLEIAIEMASALNSSDYTSETWLQLTMNLALARGTYSDANATQASVDTATKDLKAAISGLVNSGDSTDANDDADDSGSDEDDGYYEVDVRLWHASMNKASMGDPAVNKTAYVHVDGGDITMRLRRHYHALSHQKDDHQRHYHAPV